MDHAAIVGLYFFVAIFALITVVLLGVLAFAMIKINKQLDKFTTMAEPLVIKATDAIETVQRVSMNVGEKADQILSRGETLTDNVSSNVERTASVIQRVVTTPLINLSSLISGVTKGFSVYGGHSARSNGHTNAEKPKE
jgi:predicted PurR-regulated permease PerM